MLEKPPPEMPNASGSNMSIVGQTSSTQAKEARLSPGLEDFMGNGKITTTMPTQLPFHY
jgi:hypothetical protein